MGKKKCLFDHLPNYVCNNTQVVFAQNQLENMQIGTAVLYLYAEPGQEKNALWHFLVLNFKRKRKKIQEISLYP